jgi:amidase
MGRSVTDVAILLNALKSPFGPVVGQPLPDDYTRFLRRGALQGARIGRDVRYFDYSYYGSGIPGDASTVGFAEHALDVMESLGATIVDCDTGDVFEYTDDEFTALLYEFKAQIARYLATLTNTNMRTLADLIRFNQVHCRRELVYYGQEIFELAEQTMGYPTNPMYVHARNRAQHLARWHS